MQFYTLPVSLYCFKVELAMLLKGMEINKVAPPGGTYRSAAFKAINPAGTIPAISEGDFWLAESDPIIEYLEDTCQGRPLHPADHHARARARMLSRWNDLRFEPAVRRLFAQVPSSTRDASVLPEIDAEIAKSLALLEEGIDPAGPYATGREPGLADCGFLATTIWLDALGPCFGLKARPGPRLSRAISAMETNPLIAKDIAAYRAIADGWIKQREAQPAVKTG